MKKNDAGDNIPVKTLYIVLFLCIFYSSTLVTIVLYTQVHGGEYGFLATMILFTIIYFILRGKVIGAARRIHRLPSPAKMATLVILLLMFLYPLGGVAHSLIRYDRETYNCMDMSMDQMEFFNGLGIHSRYVIGRIVDNVTTDAYGNFLSGKQRGDAHMWLEINISGITIPWESTCLLPVPPTWTNSFNQLLYDLNDMDNHV